MTNSARRFLALALAGLLLMVAGIPMAEAAGSDAGVKWRIHVYDKAGGSSNTVEVASP